VTLEKLSPEGRKLVQDTRDIIDTASLLVQEKNADELFQTFVWHTRTLELDTLKPGDLGEGVDVNQEKLKKDGEQGECSYMRSLGVRDDSIDAYIDLGCDPIAVRHLRTLLSLILTNSEVRKLLQDFSTIGRDLLAKTAVKTAETVAPSNEALENVDQSAPNDQFVTEKGRNVGPGETPVLEARVPGTGHTIVQHPKEDEAIVRSEEGTERPIGEIKAEGIDRYQQFRAQGAATGNQALGDSRSQARDLQNAESLEETEVKKQGMMDRVRQMRVSLFDYFDRINSPSSPISLLRTMSGYVFFSGHLVYHGDSDRAIRMDYLIAFPNNTRTSPTTSSRGAGSSSLKSISLKSGAINLSSAVKRYSDF